MDWTNAILATLGRIHCESLATLTKIGLTAARRMGVVSSDCLVHRTLENVGVALVRRSVAMYSACLPPLSAEALDLVLGDGFNDD